MPILQEYRDRALYFHHTFDVHPKDLDFDLHVHEEYELLYFVSGAASFLVETTTYPLEPHSLLVIREMESHKIQILADKPYERFGIHFWPSLLDDLDPSGRLLTPFRNHPLGQKNLYSSDEFDRIHPKDLLEAMTAPGLNEKDRRTAILIHLYPLFGQILSAFSRKKNKDFQGEKSLAVQVVEYINQNLFEELSLEALSEYFFVSSSHLRRQFKQATGSSIWDYILNKRLVAAKNQIRGGKRSTAACQACGFRDYSSFYRAYVKKFGVSPNQDMGDK